MFEMTPSLSVPASRSGRTEIAHRVHAKIPGIRRTLSPWTAHTVAHCSPWMAIPLMGRASRPSGKWAMAMLSESAMISLPARMKRSNDFLNWSVLLGIAIITNIADDIVDGHQLAAGHASEASTGMQWPGRWSGNIINPESRKIWLCSSFFLPILSWTHRMLIDI